MSIEQVSEELQDTLDAGQSVSEIVDVWMAKDPQIIAMILLERRVVHSMFAEYLLRIIDQLEAFVPHEDLYLALGKQMSINQETFMNFVLSRHGDDFWLIGLFKELEGSMMGYHHLIYKHQTQSRDLPRWCQQYAQQGARDGLVAFAQDTGNPIPAAVLYALGAQETGLEAAVGAFICKPKSPVLEFLASKIGPELDSVVKAIDLRLKAENAPRPRMLQWWFDQMND